MHLLYAGFRGGDQVVPCFNQIFFFVRATWHPYSDPFRSSKSIVELGRENVLGLVIFTTSLQYFSPRATSMPSR